MTSEKQKMLAIAKRLTSLPEDKQKVLSERLAQEGIDIWQLPIVSNEQEFPPLSFAQQRLWFIDEMEQGTAHYNLFFGLHLRGQLNVDHLQASFDHIVQRHEILRTNFVNREGIPFQRVNSPTPLKINIVKLDALISSAFKKDSNASDEALAKLAKEEADRPFNLSCDVLLRLTLVELSNDHHVCFFTIHHIVFDAWSIDNFVLEFGQCYYALSNEQVVDWPPLDIQYKDFASWQRRWACSEAYNNQLHYWQQQLAGAPESLHLSIEKSTDGNNRGDELSLQLSPDLSKALYELTRQKDVTLYITMLAVFNILLNRYSGQTDICVGTSIANRPRLELEPLLGYFVNTLVMRNQLNNQQTFKGFLQEVSEVAMQAYEYQDMPFDHLLDVLDVQRNNARSPLFQILFVMNNAVGNVGDNQTQLPGLNVSAYKKPLDKARFDLTLRVTEIKTEQTVRCDIEFNTSLYDRCEIETLLKHFEILLLQVCNTPNILLPDLQLLNPQQSAQYQVLAEAEQVDYSDNVNVVQLFEKFAANKSNATALQCGDEQLTYGELNTKANQLAHYLRNQGIGRESHVALLLDRSSSLVIAMLAVLKAGAAYVPLDSQWPRQYLQNLVGRCDAKLVLTEAQWQTLLSKSKQAETDSQTDVEIKFLSLDEDAALWSTSPTNNPELITEPQDAAYMIYTSGSTGEPKGVVVEHRQLINYTQAVMQRLFPLSGNTQSEQGQLEQAHSFASISTVAADLGNTSIYGALCFGGCLHMITAQNAFDPDAVANYMDNHQVDVLKIVPSHLRGLLETSEPQKLLPKRLLILGGEACPTALVKQVRGLSPNLRIVNHYGPTETTVGVLTHEIPIGTKLADEDVLPVGRPLTNCKAYVLDNSGRLCPPNLPGELYIGGESVARGYYQQPELSAQKFVSCQLSTADPEQRLYRTGDKARYLENGNIEFLARIDTQVKVRGYRVELGDIETAIKKITDIRQATVQLLNDEHSSRLVAWVVAQNSDKNSSELQTELAERLPAHYVPQQIIILDALPLTANGKLDQRRLKQLAQEGAHVRASDILRSPRNDKEILLAKIWCQVLRREEVSIDDDFFDIGGDSILSLQVIAKAKKAGLKLLPKQLFDHSTIAELAPLAKAVEKKQPTIGRAPQGATIPLSYSQQRLWFLNELEGASSLYNIPTAVAIKGALDRVLLENAFAALVTRHSSLQTRFLATQATPYQEVDNTGSFAVQWQDLRQLSPEVARAEGRTQVAAFARQSYPIDQFGLFAVRVLQISDTEHWLLVNCHHIIADGWSIGILVDEFCQLYHQLDANKSPDLAKLPIQYSDYAYWQQNGGYEHYQKQLDYWLKQLAAPPALLALPTDRPRPMRQSYRGTNINVKLDSDITKNLKALAQQQKCTVYMTLLAAWQVLLHRYSGQDDICIGSPVANRHYSDTQSLVGFFANTIVLRADLSQNPSFTDFLSQVKRTTVDAQDNQDVPFEQLVDQLNVPRDASYSPLFQVLFAWGVTQTQTHQNIPTAHGELMLKNIEDSHELLSTDTSKFDMELALREEGDHIEGRLEFATDLFDTTSIERLWGHFTQLLKALIAQPEQAVAEIPLMLPQEQAQQEKWNDTFVDYAKAQFGAQTGEQGNTQSLEKMFEHQVACHGGKLAACFNDQNMSYQELDQRANQLAHYLQSRGVGSDQRVLVCQQRSLSMLVSLFAVLKAGAAYVPVDPAYPQARVRYMLEDAGASLILSDSSVLSSEELNREVFDQADHEIIVNVDDLEVLGEKSIDAPKHESGPQQLAYMIYTSGSTGKPKGVQISRANMLNFLCAMQDVVHLDASDRLLAVTSLSFDIAVLELFLPLLSGAQVVIGDQPLGLDGVRLKETLDHHAITVMQATPVSWKMLLAAGWQQKKPFTVLCGGEAFPAELAQQLLLQKSLTVWNLYGPTETTVWSTTHKLDREQQAQTSTVPIGTPIANTTIYILDRGLNPVPIGVAGELYIGGAGVALGYFGQPELTQNRFLESDTFSHRIYRTGDLARYRPDGTLECLGRLDQQVKVRGFRIELGEIEICLAQHSNVNEAAVYTQIHNGETLLVAYIVLADTAPENLLLELKTHLQKQLPDYMLPNHFMAVDALPLTPNGKVDRKALPNIDFTTAQRTYVAPRNEIETGLCEIWQSLLSIERVGIEDNFFELGGHSLLAVRLRLEVEIKFQRDVSLVQMFSHQTVAQLAELIATTEQQFKDDDMDWMSDLMDEMENVQESTEMDS